MYTAVINILYYVKSKCNLYTVPIPVVRVQSLAGYHARFQVHLDTQRFQEFHACVAKIWGVIRKMASARGQAA